MNDSFTIRENDFKFWLDEYSLKYSNFLSEGNTLEYQENAAYIMNTSYWILYEDMKGFMKDPNSRINCFKVIAGVQNIILYYQPFNSPISQKSKDIDFGINRINADFAWSVSLQIFFSFHDEDFKNYQTILNQFIESPDYLELKEFHLTWCEKLDNQDILKPNFTYYFILAQFWQTFSLYVKEFINSRKILMN